MESANRVVITTIFILLSIVILIAFYINYTMKQSEIASNYVSERLQRYIEECHPIVEKFHREKKLSSNDMNLYLQDKEKIGGDFGVYYRELKERFRNEFHQKKHNVDNLSVASCDYGIVSSSAAK